MEWVNKSKGGRGDPVCVAPSCLHVRRESNPQTEVMKKVHSSSVRHDRCQEISVGKAKKAV